MTPAPTSGARGWGIATLAVVVLVVAAGAAAGRLGTDPEAPFEMEA